MEGEETTGGVNHKAQRSGVPGAGSRRRCRLSPEATGPCTAGTASTPGREAAAGEIAGIAVSRRDIRKSGGDPVQTEIAATNGLFSKPLQSSFDSR